MKQCIALIVLALIKCAAAGNKVGNDLISTSNLWGQALALHRQSVLDLTAVVATNGDACAMLSWYQNLASYKNYIEDESRSAWFGEKAFLLRYFSDIGPISQSTNCWFAAAEELGQRRIAIAQANSLLSNLCATVQTNFMADSTRTLFNQRRELKYRLLRLQNGEVFLSEAVTNVFPRNVLPLVTEDEREYVLRKAFNLADLPE